MGISFNNPINTSVTLLLYYSFSSKETNVYRHQTEFFMFVYYDFVFSVSALNLFVQSSESNVAKKQMLFSFSSKVDPEAVCFL